ncbi:MAG: ABC transporter ATP-binding protein [Acidobacteria bacterium]|nr:MAG: ABC transporter ATP-binding protein [Acidobacteriota bacterium]
MSMGFKMLSWPIAQAEEAMRALAEECKLIRSDGDRTSLVDSRFGQLEGMVGVARKIGVEAEEIEAKYSEISQLIKMAAPAVIRVEIEKESRLILLVPGSRRRPRVLTPQLKVVAVPFRVIRAVLAGPLEATVETRIEAIVNSANIRKSRRDKTRRALYSEHLDQHPLGTVWILRVPAGAPFLDQLRQIGAISRAVLLAGTHLTQYILFLFSWWLIGRGALTGNLDPTWMSGWALLLVTLVPLRMLVVYVQGRVVIGTSALLKRRLLAGVMNLDLEGLKLEGAGMLLGRVIETDTIEAQALSGANVALLAVIEVAVTFWVLLQGAGGMWHANLFGLWLCVATAIFWRHVVAIDRWVTLRLKLTHDHTERMIGHRTRLVQEDPKRWHEGEDHLLDEYMRASSGVDSIGVYVGQVALIWRIIGIAALASMYTATQGTIGGLAVSLGGVILGGRALQRLANGVGALAIAGVAWKRAKPIFHAASDGDEMRAVSRLQEYAVPDSGPVVVARDVSFTYQGRHRAAISNADLVINSGDRILLVGPSGGGKSTLISLLGALRAPENGLLLCQGFDLATLGSQTWRKIIAIAPQFHDNHVLSETFAFNLLMGRRWPPTASDYQEATEICQELGLGDLLDRMPGGILQVVGETGWQLSHGEQSRLFVARALLQEADLVILDESFGALDSGNLKLAIECARNRAKSLVVVAHP